MNNSNVTTNNKTTKLKGFFAKAPLAMAIALATFGYIPSAQATDLDIYQGPIAVGGETSIMMLFDVANTMASSDGELICLKKYSAPRVGCMHYDTTTAVLPAYQQPDKNKSELGEHDTAYDFDRVYYTATTDGKYYYRRIDKVKMALYHILDITKMPKINTKPLKPGLAFGLSVTPNLDNDNTAKSKDNDSTKGYILAPAKPLNYVYPGTKVQNTMPMNDAERNNIRKANLPIASSNYAGWTHKDRLHDAIRRINVDNDPLGRGGYNPLALAYMETSAYLIGTGTGPGTQFSGMTISADDSVIKSGDNIVSYKAPEAQGKTCSSAKGIFVLSSGPGFIPGRLDEFTTYSPIVNDVMDGADTNLFYCGKSNQYDLAGWDKLLDTNNTFRGGNYTWLTQSPEKQWYCSTAFTRVMRGLRYDDNVDYRYDRINSKLFGDAYKSNTKLENKNLNILTGAIGFGKNMELFANSPKVTRYNYKGEPQQVADCSRSVILSQNRDFFINSRGELNASGAIPYESFCLFTEETYNFGEGGLYTGNNPEQVADALNSFISKIKTTTDDLPAISTGTMSIPFDSLNQLTPRTSAYLPILDPKVGTAKLWPGNLKKYEIKNGTIVDAADKKIFTNREGYFAKDTKDLWNTGTQPDKAKPQVGGTFEQILKGATPSTTKNRKTFVDYNGELKEVKVAIKVPQGFDTLAWTTPKQVAKNIKELNEINAITDTAEKDDKIAQRAQEMKNQLVNFLGYPATFDFTKVTTANKFIKDGTALAVEQTEDNRILGGVLHSSPQLVTYDAILNNDGSVKSREDYVLYGSFDGALHLVDDSNGEEQFSFVPHQVLQRQGKAFVPSQKDTLGDPKEAPYLHGVDAEWTVYADYARNIKTSGTTKAYGLEAKDMFAFGGLRMGGSMYYGLDISNKSDPKMIYSVGSDYALGVGDAAVTATTGSKNGQPEPGFSRMGLTWGKPTVAYVKKGGKKVMVNILPGGYDECYEDPHFKLGASNNAISGCSKSTAQGNAVYMVKVGEEEVDSKTNISKIKTAGVSNLGSLMWWASSEASANNTVSDMKHSIVSQVLALDGNYDGLTDHLYFADLGGQVWRVDIDNTKDTDDFSVKRIVKVFDASGDATTDTSGFTYSPRFYETPLVTFQRLGKNGKIFGLVTVGSGDRSNPLNLDFSNNHLYTFIDKDVARYRSELFCKDDPKTSGNECSSITMKTENVTPSQLGNISYTDAGVADKSAATLIKTKFQNEVNDKTDSIAGWKYKLDDSGFKKRLPSDPKGLKLFDRPDALNGQLYTSIFSPEKNTQGEECTATVTGQTHRERLCLPYGYCFNADGTVANRFTTLGGGGIVDNYVGYLGGSSVGEKKKIGVIDTYTDCTGNACRQDGEDVVKIEDKLSQHNTDRSFNPLKWFDR